MVAKTMFLAAPSKNESKTKEQKNMPRTVKILRRIRREEPGISPHQQLEQLKYCQTWVVETNPHANAQQILDHSSQLLPLNGTGLTTEYRWNQAKLHALTEIRICHFRADVEGPGPVGDIERTSHATVQYSTPNERLPFLLSQDLTCNWTFDVTCFTAKKAPNKKKTCCRFGSSFPDPRLRWHQIPNGHGQKTEGGASAFALAFKSKTDKQMPVALTNKNDPPPPPQKKYKIK